VDSVADSSAVVSTVVAASGVAVVDSTAAAVADTVKRTHLCECG